MYDSNCPKCTSARTFEINPISLAHSQGVCESCGHVWDKLPTPRARDPDSPEAGRLPLSPPVASMQAGFSSSCAPAP